MTDLSEDMSTTLWVVNSVFAVMATVTVVGRFAARSARRMSLGADDWIICVALMLNWAMYALAARAELHGLGKHIDTLTSKQLIAFTRNLYIMQITYVPAPPAVKLSLLFLYRRIFQYTRFLWFVYGMIVIISIWCTINLFLVIFFCTPISALWTGKGKCLDLDPYSYAVINVLTTLVVWAMPIPRVWKLQLPRRQKVALSLIFALGLFDCSTAIGRVILMPEKQERDKTWYYTKPCMMHIIEVSTGIVCTCLPTMRVSIRELFGSRCCKFGLSCRKSHLKLSSPNPTPNPNNHSNPARPGKHGKNAPGKSQPFWQSGNENNQHTSTTSDTSADLGWRTDGCRTEIARCSTGVGDGDWDNRERGSRQILVTEEIDVELRAIERAVTREAARSGC